MNEIKTFNITYYKPCSKYYNGSTTLSNLFIYFPFSPLKWSENMTTSSHRLSVVLILMIRREKKRP